MSGANIIRSHDGDSAIDSAAKRLKLFRKAQAVAEGLLHDRDLLSQLLVRTQPVLDETPVGRMAVNEQHSWTRSDSKKTTADVNRTLAPGGVQTLEVGEVPTMGRTT